MRTYTPGIHFQVFEQEGPESCHSQHVLLAGNSQRRVPEGDVISIDTVHNMHPAFQQAGTTFWKRAAARIAPMAAKK